MATHGTDTNDFLKYMAEDSANVADDGFYSVQVLQKGIFILFKQLTLKNDVFCVNSTL